MQHPHRQHRRRAIGSALVTTAALIAAGLTALGTGTAQAATARQVEALDRGVVSVHTDSGNLGGFNWSSQHFDLGGVRRGHGGLEFEDQRCSG
ncbi:hypothetical protein AB0D17_46115, partial [Streptomyces mirabilis]